MSNMLPSTLPRALKLVAMLFVAYGAWAAYDTIRGAAAGGWRGNFGMLCLVIGVGLLCRNEIARIAALAVSVVLLCFTLEAVAHYAMDRPNWVAVPLVSRVFGELRGQIGALYVLIAALVFVALNVWQVFVLMRADVRSQFGHNVRLR